LCDGQEQDKREDAAKSETTKEVQSKAEAQPQAPKSPPKKKTAAEKKKDKVEAIEKTVYSSILGVIAGFASYYILGTGTFHLGEATVPWHTILVLVIGITVLIQKVTYPLIGIDSNEFKTKDWLYVEFLVVDLWLVTWTLLLN
jgi:F0F1-type ATP synthase assembly protein I